MPVELGQLTIHKLRGLYEARWGLPWPEPNSFLTVLWNEARQANGQPIARTPKPQVWETCLTLMRECHEIPPHQLPREPSAHSESTPCP